MLKKPTHSMAHALWLAVQWEVLWAIAAPALCAGAILMRVRAPRYVMARVAFFVSHNFGLGITWGAIAAAGAFALRAIAIRRRSVSRMSTREMLVLGGLAGAGAPLILWAVGVFVWLADRSGARLLGLNSLNEQLLLMSDLGLRRSIVASAIAGLAITPAILRRKPRD